MDSTQWSKIESLLRLQDSHSLTIKKELDFRTNNVFFEASLSCHYGILKCKKQTVEEAVNTILDLFFTLEVNSCTVEKIPF